MEFTINARICILRGLRRQFASCRRNWERHFYHEDHKRRKLLDERLQRYERLSQQSLLCEFLDRMGDRIGWSDNQDNGRGSYLESPDERDDEFIVCSPFH